MRVSFNVLNDPWIPVITLNGSKEMLGIRETLQRAPELKEISAVSPLEEYSIYRFLSVFLMDALRPEDLDTIEELLEEETFDMEQIEAYIALCESEGVSFDLFDEKRPFMQSAYVKEWDKEPKPISSIDCFLPSGNNHVHFDHDPVEMKTISVDKAARLLLAIQQFCTAAAQGYPSGVNASPPYFGMIKQSSLFRTLVFCLLPIQMIEIPFDDPPVIWRSTEPVTPKKEVGQTSWLRGMYFPARRVCLVPPEESGVVGKVYLSQGENFVNKESWTDPFVSYRTLETGRVPLRPKREKPVWRSLYDIVDIRGNHASQLLTQCLRIMDEPYAEITLYGVETSQASYLDVMRHDLRFRKDLAEQETVIDLLRQCIGASERLARRLRRTMLDGHVVPAKVAEDAVRHFYMLAEQEFWKLCDSELADTNVREHYRNWCDSIGRGVIEAYAKAMESVNLRGRALAAAAEQQKWLYSEIKKIKEEA